MKYIATLLTLGLLGCGEIQIGGGTGPNDDPPRGTVVAQGAFTSQNGKDVSGIAAIYKLTSSGEFVVRLEGVSLPSETGLRVTATADGTQVFSRAVRASSGDMNYETNNTTARKWNSVSIFSAPNDISYGTAIMQ